MSKWVGKIVTIVGDLGTAPGDIRENSLQQIFGHIHRWPFDSDVTLLDVNQFWLTVERKDGGKHSEPLRKITLSFDHEAERLKIIVDY